MEFRLLPAIATLVTSCGGAAPPPAQPPSSAQASGSERNEATASAPDASPPGEGLPSEGRPSGEGPPEQTRAPVPARTPDAPVPPTTPKTTKQAPPPLPKGTTVLHIGDSFAGALGIDLNREFEKAGVRGVLKYQTASYIPTWAWDKDLDTYLRRYQPDLVIVTLGANELEIVDPSERIPTIRRLVDRISDRPCLWIGPPLWEGARDVLPPVIRANVAPCRYMDSTAILPPLERARDKIHPTMNARQEWARFVIDWLARQRDPNGATPWALLPTD